MMFQSASRLLAVAVALLLGATTSSAFSFQHAATTPSSSTTRSSSSSTALYSQNPYNSNEFLRWAKSSRSAQAGDNVVELNRPLGIVLNQDQYGNVFVETVAPRGNAARTGKVKEGDIVTMCSATFGDQM